MSPRAADPSRARPRAATAAALAATAAFCVLAGLVWRTDRPLGWERPVITAVRAVPFPTRDFWIAMFEPIPFLLVTAALACAAAAGRRARLGLAGVAGCGVAIATTELVAKPVVGRVRTLASGSHHHLVQLSGNMFPSAHTTAAAAFATFAFLVLGRRTWRAALVFVLPLVVGFAVVSKGMHDPADVLGGLLVGPGVLLAVVHVAMRPRAPRRGIASWAPDPPPEPVASTAR